MLTGAIKKVVAVALGSAACWAFAAVALAGTASAARVAVFPLPGSRVAPPQSQIAFRGIAPSRLNGITVTGSRSGLHTGKVEADSDGHGGSFLPDAPFAPRETVTVHTSLAVLGGRSGTFQFTVADPAPQIGFGAREYGSRRAHDVWTFHSAPRISPAAVRLTRHASIGPADIFIGSQHGPVQNGPEIIDPNGHLVWFQAVGRNDSVTEVQTQRYAGQPVITWWQGNVNLGCGQGVDEIYNNRYQQVAAVHAANGLMADLHEFQITPSNTALITSYYPVYWNARAVHGSTRQVVLDGVVQEIDIKTGLLLFEWHSLDHVRLTDTYNGTPAGSARPYDYFHLNSVDLDRDGTLIISSRNTWAAYKVSHRSGKIIWTLGGKRSSFRMGPGASFSAQHDVRVRSAHDWYFTIFDNGGGSDAFRAASRGLKLFVDVRHKTARRVAQWVHAPGLSAIVEGSVEQMSNLDSFVGWGSQPFFTEYNQQGKVVFDGRFVGLTSTYHAYRARWSGHPTQPPSIAASNSGSQTIAYASWNGANIDPTWRLLAGASPSSLHAVAQVHRSGFETTLKAPAHENYVAVQALDGRGRVLAQSSTIQPS